MTEPQGVSLDRIERELESYLTEHRITRRDLMRSMGALGAAAALAPIVAACSPAATTAPSSSTAVAPESAAPSEAAPASAEASAPAGGTGTVIQVANKPILGGMDASQTVESQGKKASYQVSETLVVLDEQTAQVNPKLATSWEESDDHLTFTFHLREGVTFHDGTPFNADAVVTSINRIYDESHPLHANGTYPSQSTIPIKSAAKVDDMTVTITATHADPLFLLEMSTEPGYIQSPTAMEKFGKDYTNHAVGTGPWELISFDANAQVVLKRYEGYWGTKPQAQNLIFQVNTDPSSKVADLLSGNVDIIYEPPVDQIANLRASPDIEVQIFPLRYLSDIVVNTTKPPFDDKLVRQAAAYGYDIKTLNEVLNGGFPTAQPTIWFSDAPGYNASTPTYPFDPVKAAGLLDQAGWKLEAGQTIRSKDGQPLEVTFITNGTLVGFEAPKPTLFQSNMKDIGMDVKIKEIGASVFYAPGDGIFNPANFNAAVLGWIWVLPDFGSTTPILTTASIPPGGYNCSYWSNAEVDQLMADAAVDFDLTDRQSKFMRVQQILGEEVPIIPDSRFNSVWAWRKRVSGFKVPQNDTADYSQLATSD